jgi:DNA-binding NarL/FixJ family response regulator
MDIRLMICDDHVAVREGMKALVYGTEIEVVCEAETCQQAVHLATMTKPDVVLLDIRLGNDDGLEALEELKREQPTLRVLIFSASDHLNDMARAYALGADGYVVKSGQKDELFRMIRRAFTGKKVWTVPQIRRVKSRAGAKVAEKRERIPLSDREKQVLSRLVGGASSNEVIAEDLGIDVETVKQYVRGILRKLHVEDRTQAALWGMRNGFGQSFSS